MANGFEIGMALRRAYFALHRATNALLVDSGVTADQFSVLHLLAAGDGITQQDLVRRASSDPNTIASMLRALESRGLLRRRRHDRDGRARCIDLTSEGRELQHKLSEALADLNRQLENALEPNVLRIVVKGVEMLGTAATLSRSRVRRKLKGKAT